MFCFLGFHDWHVLDSKSVPELNREVACEMDPLSDGEFRPHTMSMHILKTKCCLRCGKNVDQISVYKENRRSRMRVIADMFGPEAIEPKKSRIPSGPPPPPKKQPV